MAEKEFEQMRKLLPEATLLEAPPGLSPERQFEMYRTMLLIREFEVSIPDLWKRNLVYGLAHSYEGAEAVAVGACSALEPGDYITSTHRGHGHCIAKGADVNLMMAELMGKYEGYCHGKGGSMHIAFVEGGMLGACGIVGANVGMAAGCAWRAKLRGDKDVTVCFHGDGGTNQGIWHETLNMASIWKLPLVYMVENNQWSISLSYDRAFNVPHIADRAAAYGIPGVTVDGFNVLAVYGAVKEAVARARAGEGPSIVEAKFFRYVGHFVADDQRYRSIEEANRWRIMDPVKRMREYLVGSGVATEEACREAEAEAHAKIGAAIEFGMKGTEPAAATLFEGLYAD
ncbi:MAG: thiamine pyrophosphate-dependent dehydrogenase E1 component subunit alpha [Anaerolineales bacterium]|jgi:pyruvate dehydrogenase E1 component alpha subunit